MTGAGLFWGVLFGAVGTGYCMYAKRQQALVAGICGVGLMVVPYLVTNTYLLVLAGVALAAGPFIINE